MRPRSVALLTVAVLAAAAPAASADLPRSAKLTPSGLGGLRVGMGERAAEAAVGRPLRLRTAPGSTCATATLPHRSYALFVGGRLRRVSVSSAFWATRAGVRFGDPESAIRAAYPTAKRTRHAYTDGFYYKVRKGNRKLVFETGEGVVTTIHGGGRPEVDYIEACA